MSWRDIAPGDWGERLRLGIIAAIEQVYDENCQRFAPDDIGDNNKTFGITISENLQFVIERDVVSITDGIEVERPRNAWMLRLWGGAIIHVYKAPPDAVDVRDLRFNASKTKLELVSANGDQLELEFEEELSGRDEAPLMHIVIVHFGDPQQGLARVEVGAPYLSDLMGYDWEWTENLSDLPPHSDEDLSENGQLGSESMDSDDFGLEMRDDLDGGEQRGRLGEA